MNKLTLLIATSLLPIQTAASHPYLPLEDKLTSTYIYSFRVETENKQFKQPDVNGQLRETAVGWEDKYGRKYLHFVTSYHEIPFMKENTSMYRREENGNIYLGSEAKGKITESLELPANTEIGSEWKYSDGVDSVRKITSKTQITLPSGVTLTDCIEVSRKVLSNDSHKSAIDKNTYCRDVGKVHSIFFQPSPVGDYRTETNLKTKPTKNP